jgi:hypothetical protein
VLIKYTPGFYVTDIGDFAVEKVLERLGTTESTTLAIKREVGGKIRVASLLWEAPKVIFRGEAPEVRNSMSRGLASVRTWSTSPQ